MFELQKFELATSISFKLCAMSANPMLVAEARQEILVRCTRDDAKR